jgi:hypothetical protein
MSLLLLTLTAASAAPRECWTVKPVTGRVRDNVGHQGEELVYRLVAAGLRQAPPRAVYWPWPILPWSREVLEATLPDVEVASGDGAEAPEACLKGEKTWRPEYKRPQWPSVQIHGEARRRAYRHCNLYNASRSTLVVRILQRRDSSEHVVGVKRRTEVCGGGGIRRNLRDVDELKATISAAARTAGVGVVFETDYVENANPGGFCDQLRRFASADVLVSVHGAHLVNAPWIAPGGLLLEALPYGHKRKKHHARLLRNTDLEYVRVCGVRPSSSLPKKESLCEGRTAAARKCALVARDCYETPLRPRSQVCASSEPCECLDVLEKRLTGFFARRRQSGGRPRRRRSSTMGRGEEAL